LSQRVLLVGVARSNRVRWAKADALRELEDLSLTAGGQVVQQVIQIRPKPDPATFIGRGLVGSLKRQVGEHDVDLVVFDDELTPTQQRNLEDQLDVRVIDRTALILDIFAIHARTAEAKIQVELAQLEYRYTRLAGSGGELSRLGGGIGTRGPGETKLEVDRRRIVERLAALRRGLARIERERRTQANRRSGTFRAVLVGYTSAGKSTLLNRLTGAEARVSEQLFSTLDANTRVLVLDRRVKVLLTDTVGFIRDLPAQLIASFRSTLAEIRESDLVLNVADASNEQLDRQVDAVNDTLGSIGAGDKPVLMVFTKVDRLLDAAAAERLARFYSGALLVSGTTGVGIEGLKAAMLDRVRGLMVTHSFSLPPGRWDIVGMLRGAGETVVEADTARHLKVRVTGFRPDVARVQKDVTARLGCAASRK
jgi:GTP-binding protein HflX